MFVGPRASLAWMEMHALRVLLAPTRRLMVQPRALCVKMANFLTEMFHLAPSALSTAILQKAASL